VQPNRKGTEIMLTAMITFAIVVSEKTSRCANTGKQMPTCAALRDPVYLVMSSAAVFWKRWGGE